MNISFTNTRSFEQDTQRNLSRLFYWNSSYRMSTPENEKIGGGETNHEGDGGEKMPEGEGGDEEKQYEEG